MQIFASIDASYAVHHDAKGHSGIIITLGPHGIPIYVRAKKQKLTARSSTESELIALGDGTAIIIWCRDWMEEAGYPQDPAKIAQDNKSTLRLAHNGEGNFGKTKHINVRFFYVKELVEAKRSLSSTVLQMKC
jgi:hypothetical protein